MGFCARYCLGRRCDLTLIPSGTGAKSKSTVLVFTSAHLRHLVPPDTLLLTLAATPYPHREPVLPFDQALNNNYGDEHIRPMRAISCVRLTKSTSLVPTLGFGDRIFTLGGHELARSYHTPGSCSQPLQGWLNAILNWV